MHCLWKGGIMEDLFKVLQELDKITSYKYKKAMFV